MELRKLAQKDAPLMLEWMHDADVCQFMGRNFGAMTIENCKQFIASSQDDKENLHLAIVDDADEYMGTVSLKHIDMEHRIAEFAVTIRSCAMGKGYSRYGMAEIIRRGLEELHLDSVIWCVSKENLRANKFYLKNQYQMTEEIPAVYKEHYPNWAEMNWFVVKAEG